MQAAIRTFLALVLGISLLMVSAQLLTNARGSFGFQALSPSGTAAGGQAGLYGSLGADSTNAPGTNAESVARPSGSAEINAGSGNLVNANPLHTSADLVAQGAAQTQATESAAAATSTNSSPTGKVAAPAANSVASISQQLQQVDPFIEDLAATNAATGSEAAQHSLASAAEDQTTSPDEIPVVDLSVPAPAAVIAQFVSDAEPTAAASTPDKNSESKLSKDANAFELLGERVRSGTRKQLTWNATETLSGGAIPTPVLVVHGAEKGPVMCITAGVHGDELNGIETVRRILHSTKPEKLKGTLVGVPIVNLQGFQRQSRYLPDRRDLNRFFPGHPRGSSASRIAHSFFDGVIRHCDALVDLHTGSFHRTNLPQLRADLNTESVVELSQSFGSTVVLHSEGGVGTLRRAAVEAGIPAVTLEAGEPLRLQSDEVAHSVKGINTLLATRNMYKRRNIWGATEAVYYTSQWVRADTGGILFSEVDLGKSIANGELLGTVTDPVSNEREEIRAPYPGRVIGMALNQFVMPVFATFHIGIEAETVDEATDDVDPTILSHDVAFEPDMSAVTGAAAEPTEE